MDKKLIEIVIPTYNRERYLKDLLACIEKNFKKNPEIVNEYSITVYDNASTDNTKEVCENFKYHLTYIKNPENLGGNYNIYQGYSRASAKYVWVIGDDDLLSDDVLQTTVDIIKKESPKLIVHWHINKYFGSKKILKLKNYQELVKTANKCNYGIIFHSLISLNILSSELFDSEIALEKMDTYYAQMYGELNKLDLAEDDRPIVVINQKNVMTRCESGRIHDFPTDLSPYQNNLVEWTEKRFNIKSISTERKVIKILGIKISYRKRKFI